MTASRKALAYTAAGMAIGGTNTTTNASTSVHCAVDRTASANSSGPACAPTSTGSRASSKPCDSNASAANSPIAFELPTTATRGPAGSGW